MAFIQSTKFLIILGVVSFVVLGGGFLGVYATPLPPFTPVLEAPYKYTMAVVSGMSSGGFVAAILLFLLKSVTSRVRSLEKTTITKEDCKDAIENQKESFASLNGIKVNKELYSFTKTVFKENLQDLSTLIFTIQQENLGTQKKLASISTSLGFIEGHINKLEDKRR